MEFVVSSGRRKRQSFSIELETVLRKSKICVEDSLKKNYKDLKEDTENFGLGINGKK